MNLVHRSPLNSMSSSEVLCVPQKLSFYVRWFFLFRRPIRTAACVMFNRGRDRGWGIAKGFWRMLHRVIPLKVLESQVLQRGTTRHQLPEFPH